MIKNGLNYLLENAMAYLVGHRRREVKAAPLCINICSKK